MVCLITRTQWSNSTKQETHSFRVAPGGPRLETEAVALFPKGDGPDPCAGLDPQIKSLVCRLCATDRNVCPTLNTSIDFVLEQVRTRDQTYYGYAREEGDTEIGLLWRRIVMSADVMQTADVIMLSS